MAEYYKWYKREEEVLSGHKKIFMFAIRTPKHGYSDDTWAYITLQTSDDDFGRIWIHSLLSKPEKLPFARATKKDEEHIWRHLKGNKRNIVLAYFNKFGTE